MLKCTRLPLNVFGYGWYVNAITGSLVKDSEYLLPPAQEVPAKVSKALDFCANPYKLKYPKDVEDLDVIGLPIESLLRAQKFFMFLSNKWLSLSVLYASLQDVTFDNSVSAYSTISNIYGANTGIDCLQKSLHVAKTSRSFRRDGVLFIGANLPTGHMHSWIIENDMQPDISDSLWISYRPLLAFSFQ